jgi:hypothetical protein
MSWRRCPAATKTVSVADQLELVTKIRGFFTIKWGIFTITRSLSLDMVMD